MKNHTSINLFFILLLLVSCNGNPKTDPKIDENVLSELEDITTKDLSSTEKKVVLDQVYKKVSKLQNDSIRNKALLKISYQYFKLEDSIAFKRTNKEARKLATALKDSMGIAATYWDLGSYYHANNVKDSAYYLLDKAQKIYASIKNNFYAARILINMAIIQKNIKDYTGSEITTIEAISLLKPLKKYKHLYRAYNNLGIVFNELEEYDKSLSFYKTGLDYLEKADKMNLLPSIWNNMGVVYNNKKEYEVAAEYYNKALNYDKNLINSDPELYSMLVDNRAYNQFQSGDTTGILPQFNKALNIRKKSNDIPGITINKLHLAEYFLKEKDTSSAIEYASRAKGLAIASQNSRDLLTSLLVLSNAVKDSSLFYTREFIRINDSLQQRERSTRNKLARIRFETNKYISRTENLSQKITSILLIALGIIIFFSLLYIIKHQRSRNIKLQLIQQKQSANKEIYNLILAQQNNFDKGREKEKQHISRELHDGIMGTLAGIRMNLDALNEEDDSKIKKKRLKYIEEIGNITAEIRSLSHKLNKTIPIDVGYQTVLKEFIGTQNQDNTTFKFEVTNTIPWDKIEDDVKINMYRILQEAVYNIQKHAMATEASVSIKKTNSQLILMIEDNGKGFNHKKINKGIGLKNMEIRAGNINGKLEIISGIPEKGTSIRLIVEITQ